LILFLACQDQVVDPNSTADPLFAKGGKPKDPPAADPADPAIAYQAGTAVPGGFGTAIWVMDADGSNATELCDCDDAGSGCITWGGEQPTWSPDGRSIAYYNSSDLWALDIELDADGQPVAVNRRMLQAGFTAFPAWSPVGDLIAYDGGGNPDPDELYTVPAAGGTPTLVFRNPDNCGFFTPAWSPDGTRLAFKTCDAALVILTLSTGQVDTLIDPGIFETMAFFDWSRAGDRIAFRGRLTPFPDPIVTYVVEVATGDWDLLTDLGRDPTWSPDDQFIAIRNREYKRGRGLLIIDAATGEMLENFGKDTRSQPDWRRCEPGGEEVCGPGN